MSCSKFIFIVFLSVVGSALSEKYSDFVTPIKMLLGYLQYPVRVQAMVCWSFDERLQFARTFLQPERSPNYQFAISSTEMSNFPNVGEEHQIAIIVDLQCNGTDSLLQNAGMRIYHKFKWLALAEEGLDLGARLGQFPILIGSEFYVFVKEVDMFSVKEVYQTFNGGDLQVEPFGFVSNETHFDFHPERVASRRRRDMNGAAIRASLVVTNNDTLNHLTDAQDKHIDTISKVNYMLTKSLMEYVNATVNYTFVSSWGYKDENTSEWSGMIGDLVHNRSDVGASALFFTADRVKYIEYIAMPSPTKSKFVFRSPKLSYMENVFVLPFDKYVWYSILGLVVIVTLALLLSTWIEWNLARDSKPTAIQRNDFGFWDSVVLVYGAVCQQGSAVTPPNFTARTVVLLSFVCLMFLYTSYSAAIVALLQSPSNKIKDLNDLLNSRLKLGADDTVFNRYYFEHEKEPIRRKIYEQKITNKDNSKNFLSLAEGISRLREGLFAFHMETGVGYKLVSETFFEDEKCGLQEIQYLQVIDPWLAIQKNSSFKELFKVGMMRLHEHGLQDRENSKLYTKKPKCNSGGGMFITASLVDTRSALLLICWGFVLSIAALAVELLVHHRFSLLIVKRAGFNQRKNPRQKK